MPGHGPHRVPVLATAGVGHMEWLLPVPLQVEDGQPGACHAGLPGLPGPVPATVEADRQEVRVEGVEGQAEGGGGHRHLHLVAGSATGGRTGGRVTSG